jgi:hypothetical protein
VITIKKLTFETAITLPRSPYVGVQALDSGARVLGLSANFIPGYGVPGSSPGGHTR